IEKNNVITKKLLDSVTTYINAMQKTDYSGKAMFRIIKVVEQGSKKWSKALYQQWRETLLSVGIGRPNYYRFKVEVLPKRVKSRGKMKLKHYLKR
ncbi:MAG: glycosyltransferase family 2 protein, partial [Staphylococcus equorum]|nr:glycosyltransferase family 2 protein [Staphylococcus equorum]